MLMRTISLTRRKSVGTNSRENETCLVHVEIQCIYHRVLSISSGFFPLCKLLIILNAGNFRRRTIKTLSEGRGRTRMDRINAQKYCFSSQKCDISPSKLSQPELQRTAILCSAETPWGKHSELGAPMGEDLQLGRIN